MACVSLLALGQGVSALAEPLRLTLSEAVRRATTQSPTVAASQENLAAREWELKTAQYRGPTVNLEGRTQYGSGESTSFLAVQGAADPDNPSIKADGGAVSGSVNMSLPLLEEGTWINESSLSELKAEAQLSKARADADLKALDLASQVAKAYVNAVKSDELVQLREMAVASKRRLVDLTRQKVASKVALAKDAKAVEVSVKAGEKDLKVAQRNRMRERMQLLVLLGLDRTVDLELEPLPESPGPLPALDALIETALAHRPEIRASELTAKLAEFEVRKAKADLEPKLTLDASATTANTLKLQNFQSFYSVGLTLNMTLSDFGQRDAKVNAKSATAAEARGNLRLSQDSALSDIYLAVDGEAEARDEVELKSEEISRRLLDEQTTRELYKKKQATIDQVITDEAATLASRVEQAEARFAVWEARIDVLRAIGKLNDPAGTPGARP